MERREALHDAHSSDRFSRRLDNTLVDNDGIQQDLKDHLERTYGLAARERYWRILEDLSSSWATRDYIGGPAALRVEHRVRSSCCRCRPSSWNYPFADRSTRTP